MSADAAGAPRWRGQPGWFEIWFAVLFAPDGERAWWLRYTTFAPRRGPVRATVWAAAFRRGRAPVWGKTFVPVADVAAAVVALRRGACAGRVAAGGRTLAWDLGIDGGERGGRAPGWLGRVPAPTHVAHLRSEAAFRGRVDVDGVREDVAAVGTVKHLWGTRRVDELYWIYSPALAGGGALEATTVRVRAGAGPSISPVWLRAGGAEHVWWRAPGLLRARVVPEGPGRLRLAAASATRRLDVVATCDPATLAGWAYRDPAGHDLHVAQSDVARLEGTLVVRPHPLAPWGTPRPIASDVVAVELHQPSPLPGVRYVAWDAVSV